MKIKGLIFDLDGTLADTLPGLNRAMNITRARFGLAPIGRKEVLAGINDGPRMFVKRTFPEGTSEAVIEEATALYIADYEHCYMDTREAFDGMVETLNALRDAGCKLSVLTNKPDTAAKLLTRQIFGDALFDPVLGVTDKPLKPEPDTALAIAEKFGLTPDEMCFVGDSHIDMQTGNNAGMHTIGVSYGYKGETVLRENHAEFIAHTPKEIWEIVKNIK